MRTGVRPGSKEFAALSARLSAMGDGGHRAGGEVGDADAVVVGIGDVQPARGRGQTTRFEELRSVPMAGSWSAAPEQGLHALEGGVQDLDLVVVGVGDIHAPIQDRNAQRVLEADPAPGTVPIAELEQPHSHQGADPASRAWVNAPDRAGLAVRDEQQASVGGDAARLVHGRVKARAINQRLAACAADQIKLSPRKIKPPHLMASGHGDVENPVEGHEVPRGVQAGREGIVVRRPKGTMGLASCPRHTLNPPGAQIQAADQMVLRVGDVETSVVECDTLRVAEACLRKGPIFSARLACAGQRLDSPVHIRDDDPVVSGVGDRQSARGGVHDDLAGKGERGGVCSLGSRARSWPLAQGARCPVLCDHIGDGFIQNGAMSFSRHGSHHVAGRVYEDQGGPGPHAVALPDDKVGVIDYRMGDLVSPDGVTERSRLPLIGELGGVDPDDRQGLGVFRFQRLQLREDVQAVDSAVGPEVEQHHPPAEIS